MTRRPLILAAALLLLAAICPAQTTQPTTRSALGMNTNEIAYWDSAVPFADEVKSAGTFGSPTTTGSLTAADSPGFDAWGWPTDDFGMYLSSGRPVWPGVHKVRCGGKVDSIKLSASAGTVSPPVYDPASNVTTADVSIPATGEQLVLRFTGTNRNPADPAAGKGVAWVQVLCPGYTSSTTSETGVFTSQYLSAFKPFGHVRLMGFNHTNSHPVSTWAERAKLQEAQWNSKRGVPWEVQLDLCKRTGVAPWICVPDSADDDYVINLAGLFRDGLAGTSGPVYVEDSNEVWNATLGTQYGHNKQAAEAEVASGDPNGYTLPVTYWNPDSGKDETLKTTGTDVWLWFRHARRSWHLTKIFRDVFGPEQAYRVRGVFGAQNGDSWRTSVTLGYVARQLGNPADLFYGEAIAPYFGNGSALLKDPAATSQLLAQYAKATGLAAWSNPDGKVSRHRKLADHWKIQLLAYEGGLDWGQNKVALAEKLAAMRDPLTGEGNAAYYTGAFKDVGFSAFTGWLCGRYGQWGFYHETGDVRDLTTQRYTSAARVAGQFMYPDPVKPDPSAAVIAQLRADLAAAQAAGAAAKAEAAEKGVRIERAQRDLAGN